MCAGWRAADGPGPGGGNELCECRQQWRRRAVRLHRSEAAQKVRRVRLLAQVQHHQRRAHLRAPQHRIGLSMTMLRLMGCTAVTRSCCNVVCHTLRPFAAASRKHVMYLARLFNARIESGIVCQIIITSQMCIVIASSYQ